MDEKEQLKRLKGFVNDLLDRYDGCEKDKYTERLLENHGIIVREVDDTQAWGRCYIRKKEEWLKNE